MSVDSQMKQRPAFRSGLTLIEMLVAVTITLMVILAIVQIFDLLGTNIKNGQALIETTTDLRFISQQIQNDIDGVTCPVRTWLDPSEGEGYFEAYDGPSRDRDWNAFWNEFDKSRNEGFDMWTVSDPSLLDEDTSMGDVDDYLSLTTRNITTPFSGRVPKFNTVSGAEYVAFEESKDAEVTWWTAVVITNYPTNGNLVDVRDALASPGNLSPTASVALFRHAGLVMPGIDLSPSEATTLGRPAELLQDVLDFIDNYDVSVRWIDTDGDGDRDMLFANSLADLTQRESRFMRYFLGIDRTKGIVEADPTQSLRPTEITAAMGEGGFPFPLARVMKPSRINLNRTWNIGAAPPVNNWPLQNEISAFAATLSPPENSALQSNLINFDRPRFARFPYAISIFALSGETVDSYKYYSALMARSLVSDNIRAFDLRFYDPNAPLFTPLVGGTPGVVVLAPGDPGYPVNNSLKYAGIQAKTIALSGLGAYVDLQYANGYMRSDIDVNGDGATDYIAESQFTVGLEENYREDGEDIWEQLNQYSVKAHVGWWPFYDTWSKNYERDGVNQFTYSWINGPATIDEGTNEFDDTRPNRLKENGVYTTLGVDDAMERETGGFLAYDVPLRGIKITIRKMDYETRQIRQTSVVGDFVPE